MKLHCISCGKVSPLSADVCPCGGCLDLSGFAPECDPRSWAGRGVWRYAADLPLPLADAVRLGEGGTPLVRVPGLGARFKLEYFSPTGSFKDRGASLVVTQAVRAGAGFVVEDSSGNAGAAVAAYAANAGLACTIVMPEGASAAKEAQVRALGAAVEKVGGPRRGVTDHAMGLARRPGVEGGTPPAGFFASHVASPWFHHGTKTVAYELLEELGPGLCDAIVMPTAQASLLLGLYKGLAEISAAGRIERLPRLMPVQAAGCAPLVKELGGREPEGPPNRVADGIQIPEPPRLAQMADAVRKSEGTAVAVSERETLDAMTALHRQGLLVEPTSAAALAGLKVFREQGNLRDSDDVVVLLTGRYKPAVQA